MAVITLEANGWLGLHNTMLVLVVSEDGKMYLPDQINVTSTLGLRIT